jgi:hypothetical protein
MQAELHSQRENLDTLKGIRDSDGLKAFRKSSASGFISMAHTTADRPFLHGRGDLVAGARTITSLEWECDEFLPHPVLSMNDLRSLLLRALTGEVPLSAVHEWADAIEGRTDLVEYENQSVADLLFELATPEINGDLTPGRIEKLLAVFS